MRIVEELCPHPLMHIQLSLQKAVGLKFSKQYLERLKLVLAGE